MRGEPCCGWRGVGSAFPTGTMPCACCPCRRTADASEIEPTEPNGTARSEGRDGACPKNTLPEDWRQPVSRPGDALSCTASHAAHTGSLQDHPISSSTSYGRITE